MYRLVKFTYHPFDDWQPIIIVALQVLHNDTWHTLNASDKIADIKHACHEGRNQEEKVKAYQDFISGH